MDKLKQNKEESLRNNKYPTDLGLLRGGFIFCGICGKRMTVRYSKSRGTKRPDPMPPVYRCYRREGKDVEVFHNHSTQIHVKLIDEKVKNKIIDVLYQPEVIRTMVEDIRKKNRASVNKEDVEASIEAINGKFTKLCKLAEDCTDNEYFEQLTKRLKELESEKRNLHRVLDELEDDTKERELIEGEIQKFEKWAAAQRECLGDPAYMENATYEELRLVVKILGIRVTVYPTKGDYPYRDEIIVTVPKVMEKMSNLVSESSQASTHNVIFFCWQDL